MNDTQRQKVMKATFLDDFIVRMMFLIPGSEHLFQTIVRTILDDESIVIKKVSSQKQETLQVTGKTVVFDALGEDEKGNLYDLEIQKEKQGAKLERANFYGGVLDTLTLKAGEDYSQRKERYLIFLCPKDFFRKKDEEKLKKINFELCAVERHRFPETSSHLIYVFCDCNANDDSCMTKLIHDFKCSDPSQLQLEEFRDKMMQLKGGGKNMEEIYSDIAEEIFAEGEARGKLKGEAIGEARGEARGKAQGEAVGEEKGKAQTKEEFITKFLRAGFSAEQIASVLEIPLSTVLSIQAKMSV